MSTHTFLMALLLSGSALQAHRPVATPAVATSEQNVLSAVNLAAKSIKEGRRFEAQRHFQRVFDDAKLGPPGPELLRFFFEFAENTDALAQNASSTDKEDAYQLVIKVFDAFSAVYFQEDGTIRVDSISAVKVRGLFKFKATALEKLGEKASLLELYEEFACMSETFFEPSVLDRWQSTLYSVPFDFQPRKYAPTNDEVIRQWIQDDPGYRSQWESLAEANRVFSQNRRMKRIVKTRESTLAKWGITCDGKGCQ